MSFRLLLPAQLLADLFAQARAELPNECCGLLAGGLEAQGKVGRVVKRYPLVNALASPTEYESDAHSMFEAVRDMRRLGLEILAVYHSHPTSDPVPSVKDSERNYSEEVMNLIVSLKEREPVVRAWWLTAESMVEGVWEVIEEPTD
ncbi:MAG: M67 family metallopeptidase [Gemmataceae bacterium]|nr:M67 family metallopeptidase [Gemmataceae bacterium]